MAFEEITYLDDAIKIISENRQVLDPISGIAISRTTSPIVLSEIQCIQTQPYPIGFDETLLKELRVAKLARTNSLLKRPVKKPITVSYFSAKALKFLESKNNSVIHFFYPAIEP
ncbi:MAG: hypothetical protein HQM08_28950 [Candidatus Riflebacteria bacterium]|nr:hypothetical protein [Candidatus Riflebacteria bacterium]